MSTFFPAGGTSGNVGHWWRMVHSALEAGADLDALRLVHVAGMPPPGEDVCAALEERLGNEAACMAYDPTAILIIEPGLSDPEIMGAVCDVLSVTPEQVRLWAALAIHDDGLDFQPVPDADAAAAGPSTTPPAVDEVVLTDAEFSYIPLWDIQRSEIFAYVCEAVWRTEDGRRVPEQSLSGFFAKPRHVFALDREALHKAVNQAQEFLDRYIFTNMMIPVHYSTIADPALKASYFDAFNDGIWAVIDNVYFEITKIPGDLDGTLLNAVIDELTPFGQGVMLRVEHGFEAFQDINPASVMSVGLDFRYDDRTDRDIEDELNAFAASCRGVQVDCHAHSLKSMDTCIGASNAGYRFISSNVIAPPIDTTAPEDEMSASLDALRAMLKPRS